MTVEMGIVSTGMYLPDGVMTSAEIAEASGLPLWVVEEKLGIAQKHVAGPDDHPNEMAATAATRTASSMNGMKLLLEYTKYISVLSGIGGMYAPSLTWCG